MYDWTVQLTHRGGYNRYYQIGIWVKVNLEIMAIKEHSTFSKAPGVELDHQMQFSAILRAHSGGILLIDRDRVSVFYSPTKHIF